MKKLVVLSAVVLGMAMSANAENEYKLLWRVDEGILGTGTAGVSRQGVGHDNKFYLTHHDGAFAIANQGGWIDVYGEDGFIEKITCEGGINGLNITSDDAGNIIARRGIFANPFAGDANNGGLIYNAATKESTLFTLNTSVLEDGRADFWGHVSGNVLSEEGGLLVFGANAAGKFNEVKIVNGTHVTGGQQGIKDTYYYKDGMVCSTTSLFSTWDWMPNEMAVQLSPTSPIYHMVYGATENTGDVKVWSCDGVYYTPDHNETVGYALFKIKNETYIIYSRGSNKADAIVIAKASVKVDGANDSDFDPNSLILVKTYGEMNEAGTVTKYNGGQYDHFNVELSEDGNTAYIYQFSPGNFIAKHSFTPDNTTTSIAAVEASENAPVEYFNLQGIRVNNPENGIFIRRQGNKVTKVVK